MSDSHLTNEQDAKERSALARKLKRVEQKARKRAILEREEFIGLQIRPTASLEDDAEGLDPGEDNWTGLGFDIHPQVTIISSAILIGFILLTLMFAENASDFAKGLLAFITSTSGWFLILASNIFIIAAAYFAFGKFGRITIGGEGAKPEFSTLSWYAMLLSAGMGIGLMFWSVGEPMFHYAAPSPMFGDIEGGTPEAAQAAMGVTFFHWGIHPWAVMPSSAWALLSLPITGACH